MPSDQRIAEVRRWLLKAANDHRMAEVGLAQNPPITDAAAFHCQQAVEKTLKAFLVFHAVAFEKVHDLSLLAETCATIDPAFGATAIEVAPLTAFAVRFRYPGPSDPTIDR